MNLKELSVYHPYYCSEGNYYSNDPNQVYNTATAFLDDFEDADIDMNLCFRFDVHEYDHDDERGDGFYAEIFLILQRKGIFMPIMIRSVSDDECERLHSYLKRHYVVLQNMWAPISSQEDKPNDQPNSPTA